MSDCVYLACLKCKKAAPYLEIRNNRFGYSISNIMSLHHQELIDFIKTHHSHDGWVSLDLISEQDYLDNYAED